MLGATPAMHKDFPRWYAAVAVGGDTERRAARWAAVHSLAENADISTVEALVRLAFSTTRHPADSRYLLEVHETFRSTDDSFDPKNAIRELQVLAGASLWLLCERNDDIGAAAALSVTTAAFF